MARKNLLAGLTGALLPAGNSPPGAPAEAAPQPQSPTNFSVLGTRGAIGAVSRSIEQLKAQSVIDIAPHLVDASFVSDRLEGSSEHHLALVESIREHGQQVPILVRPHPEKEGRFQIAYGRRRLMALAELGRNIRAVVKPLTDAQLVVAQGQENSARKDLTFIEKALFAARLEQGGFARETIMAAMTVDKTGLSRLISSAEKIPHDLIETIGSAPSIGRDRWVEMSSRLERAGSLALARDAITKDGFASLTSDQKFECVFAAVAPKPTKSKVARSTTLKSQHGFKFGNAKEDAGALTVLIDKKVAGDFASYLLGALPELYDSFKRSERHPSADKGRVKD
jgi:ParB family chromosome partitioning protein